ncbi:hypothetical protein RJV41_00605 [Buchnera aphidicola (Neophyllaphis podocarpi)]|uniref:hypothetical protein n=1 Tax=Buchnera aphidicola TaxID=9 RepID=UPI0031B83129
MKKNIIIFIIINILLIVISKDLFAEIIKQEDLLKISTDFFANIDKKSNLPLLAIKSNFLRMLDKYHIIFYPKVYIKYKDILILSDKTYLSKTHKFYNKKLFNLLNIPYLFYYKDNKIIFHGRKGIIDLFNEYVKVSYANYKIIDTNLIGSAKNIFLNRNNKNIIIDDGFITFYNYKNIFRIFGTKIIKYGNKSFIDIFNAKFYINNFLVFYIPYLKIYINKNNKKINIPYISYFKKNIIKQIDFIYFFNQIKNIKLYSISNYLFGRGLDLKNKLNYFNSLNNLSLEMNHLISKKQKIYYTNFNNIKLNLNYLNIYFNHWNYNFYLNYLGSPLNIRSKNFKYVRFNQSYLMQKMHIFYVNKNLTINLSFLNHDFFYTKNFNNLYQFFPKFSLFYYSNFLGPFNLNLYFQLTKFKNINFTQLYNEHLYFNSKIKFNIINCVYGYLNGFISTGLFFYHTKNLYHYNNFLFNKNFHIIPLFNLNSKIIFYKNIPFYKNNNQYIDISGTYIYLPLVIKNFFKSYHNFFLKHNNSLLKNFSFSNFKRMIVNHQFLSILNYKLSNNYIDFLSFSIGKLYYLSFLSQNINLYQNIFFKSVLFSNIKIKLYKSIILENEINYNLFLDDIFQDNFYLGYFFRNNKFIKLKYRFINQEYAKILFIYNNKNVFFRKSYNKNYNNKDISYFYFLSNWKINNYLLLKTKSSFNIFKFKFVDNLISIEYNSDFYIIKLNFIRHITKLSKQNNFIYDNKLSFDVNLMKLNRNNLLNLINFFKNQLSIYTIFK